MSTLFAFCCDSTSIQNRFFQPKFLYATAITYSKNKNDQIAFEYVNKYAASLISDHHSGSYEDRIKIATLDPIWKISAGRRLSLIRAYVDNMRFIPDNYLSPLEAPHTLGLRSNASRSDENQMKFAQPIDSRRIQCQRTALSHMIYLWNSLSNYFSQLSYITFKNKNREILNYLIEMKALNPLDVPVRNLSLWYLTFHIDVSL